MNSRLKKQTEALEALSATDRARLDRLAALAKTTPEDMLQSVQKWGFEDMEDSVQAWLDAEEDYAAGRTIAHEDVMEKAMQIVSQNGQRKRKTG